MIELLIQNGNTIYQPIIEGDIKWETQRKGQPGKLTFSVVPRDINFHEGDSVRLVVDGHKVFYGFIFKKERDKNKIISVTAYDQLRYFRNKNTYIYSNKTVGELIRIIADDFNLNVGTLADTGYKIGSRIEENKSLMEIVQNALDLTLQARNRLYVLYDDFGKLTLRDVESMRLDLLIDEESAENFKYMSSIDGETYNRIKLAYSNESTGKIETYIAQDSSNINRWGVLQYFESIDNVVNPRAKADALLRFFNNKKRSLVIPNAFGDPRVRAGSSIPVSLSLGDIVTNNYMVVERVVHTFGNDDHTMNLTVRGGYINA